ncbi:MAG: helix-turn-helix domain-containing protein [Xenococcus sp. (in: cyanobacteria)]
MKNDINNQYEPTGEKIKNLRLKNNLTQNEFAEILEVTPITIQRWEKGERKCSGKYARKIKDFENLGKLQTEDIDGEITITFNFKNLNKKTNSKEEKEEHKKEHSINNLQIIGNVNFYL